MVGSPGSGGYPNIESKMPAVAVGRSIGIAMGFENDLLTVVWLIGCPAWFPWLLGHAGPPYS